MGTLSLTVPFVLIDRSMLRAGTGFYLLPSLHHHPTYNTFNILQNLYTYSHPNHSTQIQMYITHVMWSAQEVREIDHTSIIYPQYAESENRYSSHLK